MLQYFNKLINITFQGSEDSFTITTPKTGIKPNILLSGTFTGKTEVMQFEIKITNLYTSKSLTEYKEVIVEAGYENSISTVIVGTISSVYTSKPGPDKETTIICTTANLTDWINTTVNIKEKSGAKLKDVAEQISSALGYKTPYLSDSLKSKTFEAPFLHNGTARQAIAEIKKLFDNLDIVVNSNQLFFLDTEKEQTSVTHTLKFLTQEPQYSGTEVNLSAPWIPNIKPGDFVEFPNKFYSIAQGSTQTTSSSKMRVTMIQFSFGTIQDNEMSLTGIAEE